MELSKGFLHDIREIILDGRRNAFQSVNAIMIQSNWLLGKRIVEEEQHGQKRAEYGISLLKLLSSNLTREFGNGYGWRNLFYYRQFYQAFPDLNILHTRMQNLSWSHIKAVLRVNDESARDWYLKEASEEGWGVRTLDRNISTQYYQRLLMSQNQEKVKTEMCKKSANLSLDKLEFIKNPMVAEFLGFVPNMDFAESDLESAIITHLQKFIMELGKGFAFVARQQHIATDAGDFFVDLVFYNYILKCFVLIDLKTARITHQDVGQMDMYIRMYDELKRSEGDNPSIGLILCSETSRDIARYSILNGSKQLFASKYLPYLPSEEELRREIEIQKEFFFLTQNSNNDIGKK